MRTLSLTSIAIALTAVASGQPPASVPQWLTAYPDAKAETRTFPARIESTYTTPDSPDQVAEYYRRLFAAASVPFVLNSDGIGLSIRGAAAECDLLITIREQSGQTVARVSCATKAAARAALPQAAPTVIGPKVTSPTNATPSQRMAERIRQGEEETRRVLAEAEAKHKKGIQDMTVYDQPVNGRAKKNASSSGDRKK